MIDYHAPAMYSPCTDLKSKTDTNVTRWQTAKQSTSGWKQFNCSYVCASGFHTGSIPIIHWCKPLESWLCRC